MKLKPVKKTCFLLRAVSLTFRISSNKCFLSPLSASDSRQSRPVEATGVRALGQRLYLRMKYATQLMAFVRAVI